MRVVVEGLAHRFPGTDLLFEHLDFVAEPGSTIAVCGPSGCGKSTLLSILAGWEKPYAGTVTREGVNRVGWVFQNPYGVAERTALDHVVFPLLAKGMRRKEAEPKALEAMGLFDLEYAADRRFSDLSGGEAQRLMLARAVCSKPDMLLVDEPTAQLDTRTAHSVSHVLNNLSGQGMIVLVATHDPDTRDACDRVLDLADYAPGGSKSQEPELERQFTSGRKEKTARNYLEKLSESDYTGKRILLVEDNELNREIAGEILQMTGAEVEIAENGKIAVEKVEASPKGSYDLVFMDIQMPVMNGYEATAAIRSLPGEKGKLPIVAMTANAFAEDVQLAKNTGMNGHIAKPLDMNKLNDVLESWL